MSPPDRWYRDLTAGLAYRLVLIRLPESVSPPVTRPAVVCGSGAALPIEQVLEVWSRAAPAVVRILHMHPDDNDPDGFLGRLQAAVVGIVDGTPLEPERSPEVRLVNLINRLVEVPQEMALVLIGLEIPRSGDLQALLVRFVDYLPPRLHLYLLVSEAPLLPNLARLRVRRQLLELDWRDVA